MKRKLVSIILSVSMAAALFTGCGSSASTAGTSAEAGTDGTAGAVEETAETTGTADDGAQGESWQDQDITLKVLWGQSTTDAGAEDMIDEALAEVYPNLHIEWECVDWGEGFGPKMQQYMQSGLPDVMIGKGQDVKTYASLGVLGDLTDLDAVDKVLDDATKGVTVDGKVYGIVYNALYQGVFYNRQVFKDLGLEVPKTQEDLQHVIDVCKENDRGIFVLVKTSNPSSGEFQDRAISEGDDKGRPLYEIVAEKVAEWGQDSMDGDYSNVGAVVGATYPEMGVRLRKLMPKAYILVPGYGAQGGSGKDLKGFFNEDGLGAIVNSSRGIIAAYKNEKYASFGAEGYADASRAAVEDMLTDIRENI